MSWYSFSLLGRSYSGTVVIRYVITRREAIASPSIGITLWRVWTAFTRSAITPPEVNRFGWHLGHSEYIVFRWLWQILGAIRAEAEARERGDFLFFLWGKWRTTLTTSGRPNSTKFAHKTWICVAMNPFGTHFWKSPCEGSFFQKGTFFDKIANDLRLQAPITP